MSIPPHILPALGRHLSAFVGPEPASAHRPPRAGDSGGTPWRVAPEDLGRPEIHFHDLRGAGLTWGGDAGCEDLRELMARIGHASPAAALRYGMGRKIVMR